MSGSSEGGIRRGSTKNLRELFEKITNEAKVAEAAQPKNFSTLPKSFRQSVDELSGGNSLTGSPSSSGRVSIIAAKSIFEQPPSSSISTPSVSNSSSSSSPSTTIPSFVRAGSTTNTTPSPRAKRTLVKNAQSSSRSNSTSLSIDQHLANLKAVPALSTLSLPMPGDTDGILHKPEKLLDTIRYIRDSQLRYQRCFTGATSGYNHQVDQLKVQTLLQTNQMFMDMLEKQATEVVSFMQQYHAFLRTLHTDPSSSLPASSPPSPLSSSTPSSDSTQITSSSSPTPLTSTTESTPAS